MKGRQGKRKGREREEGEGGKEKDDQHPLSKS